MPKAQPPTLELVTELLARIEENYAMIKQVEATADEVINPLRAKCAEQCAPLEAQLKADIKEVKKYIDLHAYELSGKMIELPTGSIGMLTDTEKPAVTIINHEVAVASLRHLNLLNCIEIIEHAVAESIAKLSSGTIAGINGVRYNADRLVAQIRTKSFTEPKPKK